MTIRSRFLVWWSRQYQRWGFMDAKAMQAAYRAGYQAALHDARYGRRETRMERTEFGLRRVTRYRTVVRWP